jgi:hypothetical protein
MRGQWLTACKGTTYYCFPNKKAYAAILTEAYLTLDCLTITDCFDDQCHLVFVCKFNNGLLHTERMMEEFRHLGLNSTDVSGLIF